MQKLIHWLDHYLLVLLAGFLLVFIPLYPKMPLFEVLPGYIVRVRLEDLLIAFTVIVYIVMALRGKVPFWNTPLTRPIILYLMLGGIAVMAGIIIGSIPFQPIHINKALLHYFRRVEYFSVFFIFYSVTTSFKRTRIFISLFLFTVLAVTIYGYGQKYLYWPAFSTMNREFAKGWRLYLSEHARVISTFGGHYDLAAYIMTSLTVLWSLIFGTKKYGRILLFLLLAASFWIIILTASRVSFIAYLIGLSTVIFVWMFRKGVGWAISRWIVTISLSILVMLSFGDLSDRFLHLFKIDERVGGIRTLLLKPLGAPPEKAVPLDNSIDTLTLVTSKSDYPPTIGKPGRTVSAKPSDVKEELPDYVNIMTETGEIKAVRVKRTFSATALRFDLSTGIRLDVLWPRAWQGFLRDPLFGSGYSTLTKAQANDFTEAESTDNGYLRSLGETGALGTIAFFAIIFIVMSRIWWALAGTNNPVFFAILTGGLAAIVGLMVNAIYIDIFEASKVALPFWSISGIILGGIHAQQDEIAKNRKPFQLHVDFSSFIKRLLIFFKSDRFIVGGIIVIAFIVRLHAFHSPLADWHSWRQADTSSVTRNFFREGINFLYPTFDDISSIPSGLPNPRGLRMVEFPIYNAVSTTVKFLLPEISIEEAGRFTSILASLGSLLFIFLLVSKYSGRLTAILSALFFAVLPFNIYYSRVILPEPSVVFTSLGMLYFLDRWLEKTGIKNHELGIRKIINNYIPYGLAVLFAALSLLIKPYSAFLFLPLIYLIIRYRGIKGLISPSLIIFFVATVAPFVWWRWWIGHFPEGIPAYTWLFNGDNIRFKGAFFFWIFADRLGRLILGYWGLPILVFGILAKPRSREGWFYHVWFLSILLYLTTFATGNIRHDYYQTITIPIITILLARGIVTLLNLPSQNWNKIFAWSTAIIASIFMTSFGWYHVRDYFNINHPEIVDAGIEADKLLNSKGLVIAPYDGDTAFLYQTNRSGWPIMEGSIDEMITKGAHYYVSVRDDDTTKWLLKEIKKPSKEGEMFKLLKSTPKFTIIQLVADKDLPH